jgi:hypothetical protein
MPLPQNQLNVSAPGSVTMHAFTGSAKFSWPSELRHFVSYRFLNILWWPIFKLRQRWFSHSPFMMSCKKLPEFAGLWKTIQKGAFAYNSLFLRLSPLRRSSTDLADITTLALFFGDEFIDGLAGAAGKPLICKLAQTDPERFYLRKKITLQAVTLEYLFELDHLLPPDVLRHVNEKYKITYQEFYDLLQHFLVMMNECLRKLPFEKAQKAADKIADACNTCLESFLNDVHSLCQEGHLKDEATVLHFHETKTAYMQEKLLELRCVLADREQSIRSVQMPGWLNIMRVVQIYDDLQDMIIDDGLQDNLVLSVAYNYFPGEWRWFCKNKILLLREKQKYVLLALHMPGSLQHCFQLASERMKTMNWEQQKIMHYLILKNDYSLYKSDEDNLDDKDNFSVAFYQAIKDQMPHVSNQAIKAFVIDTCIHLTKSRRGLLRRINFSTGYQLRYNLLSVPQEIKAFIFDRIAKN